MLFGALLLLQLVVVLCCLPFACGVKVYSQRMLRNPGLLQIASTTCVDSCVSACQSAAVCSAVSYQVASGTCILSYCNNLDAVFVNGWITIVLLPAAIEEGSNAPPSQLEWMLTDACGVSSQGILNGPNMISSSVTYSPSLSVYAGNANVFAGSSTSYRVTEQNSIVSFPMGANSLSVMFWVNWAESQTSSCFLEFLPVLSSSSDVRGMMYWLHIGGLFYGVGSTGVTYSGYTNIAGYSFTPVINSWYHVAYVYDGSIGIMKIYLNYTLVSVYKVFYLNNLFTWQYVRLGQSNFYNQPLKGRIFCLKILNISLTNTQVTGLGQSCISGKVRLSG